MFGNDFLAFKAEILFWLAGSKHIRFGGFKECKAHLCFLKDFKDTACQSWCIVCSDQESNPGCLSHINFVGLHGDHFEQTTAMSSAALCPLLFIADTWPASCTEHIHMSQIFIYFCEYLLNNPKEMIMHLSSTLLKHMEQLWLTQFFWYHLRQVQFSMDPKSAHGVPLW